MSHHRHREEKKPTQSLPTALPLLTAGDLELLRNVLPEMSATGQRLIGVIIKAFENAAASLDINRLIENLPGSTENSISPELLSAVAPILGGLNANNGSLKDLMALFGSTNN